MIEPQMEGHIEAKKLYHVYKGGGRDSSLRFGSALKNLHTARDSWASISVAFGSRATTQVYS